MPKVFSPDDRDAIRRSLLDNGRRHFMRFGLRKTNVEMASGLLQMLRAGEPLPGLRRASWPPC